MAWQQDHLALRKYLAPEFGLIAGGADSAHTVVLHMTSMANLPNIVAEQTLYCDRTMQANGQLQVEIGDLGVKEFRRSRKLEIGPKPSPDYYVPFYFAPRSPMLYKIHMGSVPSYKQGQGTIVYLATTMQAVATLRIPWLLTDGNCAVRMSKVYDQAEHLDKVDWAIMRERYWNDTLEDPDRMRRRMAEFLVHDQLPFGAIKHVVAMTTQVAELTQAVLESGPHRPSISVNRNWYY
jgi:hypothetical protein